MTDDSLEGNDYVTERVVWDGFYEALFRVVQAVPIWKKNPSLQKILCAST